MYIQALHVYLQVPLCHPDTAAVNQTVCSLPIQGRAFAIALHSKPEKPKVNISYRNYKISKIVLQHFRSKENPIFLFEILASIYFTIQTSSKVS